MLETFINRIRRITEPAYYKLFLIPRAANLHRKRVRKIRRKARAKVVFVVSSLPMWRFQNLYDLIRKDSRFQIELAIYPFPSFSPAQRDTAVLELRNYFSSRGMPFVDLSGEASPGRVLREKANPDIIFYPQPYNNLFGNDLDCRYFEDCLISYIPYAMLTAKESWAYRTHLNNIAWRLFYPWQARKAEAEAVLYNRGKNIRITGEVMSDIFAASAENAVWKKQESDKKRIIWAPHFTIYDSTMLHRDSFTWLSKVMWDVAEKYRDAIQFAFKPHPRLLSELHRHPDWGQDKADSYYRQWAEGTNTQLETGSYIDLFKGSDAMIHDCGSFSVEYHFTGKPVLFTARDLKAAVANQNELGRGGILAHYQGSSEADIINFIEDVVLDGKDPMEEERLAFREQFLRPPGGRSVAQNIYNEILSGIGW